jgi:hypothetical protein
MVNVPVPVRSKSVMERLPVIFRVLVPGTFIMMLSVEVGPATEVAGVQLAGVVQLLFAEPFHVYVVIAVRKPSSFPIPKVPMAVKSVELLTTNGSDPELVAPF